MDCRKNVRPIERATIYTKITKFYDSNDVEERSNSVKYLYL